MKILFLDIDGVLNSVEWWESLPKQTRLLRQADWDHFDPCAVDLVNHILDATGAKVVISSAWRTMMPWEELTELLSKAGLNADIIGKTPSKKSSERVNEITGWLDAQEGVEGIVILEDDWPMEHLEPWTVRTTWLAGIQESDVQKAVDVLNSPWPGIDAAMEADCD
jgi:hypothetical protein